MKKKVQIITVFVGISTLMHRLCIKGEKPTFVFEIIRLHLFRKINHYSVRVRFICRIEMEYSPYSDDSWMPTVGKRMAYLKNKEYEECDE